MATLQSLITRTERFLSQSAGTAVQTYAEPRIANYIQTAFDSLFLKVWWPQYMVWETLTLDGVTGTPTANPQINRLVDMRAAYRGGTNHALRMPPTDINPNTFTGDTTARYITGQATSRVFKIFPLAATGTVDLTGRVYPGTFGLSDTINMDDTLISLLAAWHYCVDDGNNPAQAEKFLQAFTTHFDLTTANLQNAGISLDPRLSNVPSEWWDVG